jgi:hypothetical protein
VAWAREGVKEWGTAHGRGVLCSWGRQEKGVEEQKKLDILFPEQNFLGKTPWRTFRSKATTMVTLPLTKILFLK